MSNKVYDVLVYVVQIVLPAVATLYAGLAVLWGLPMAEQVVGTITLITTFLGTCLRISNAKYKKKISN